MKKLIATTLALSAFSGAAMANQTFQCNDSNYALSFALYEDASGTRGGHMYINGIQAAALDTYRVNDITVRGTVVGNTVKAEFVFNADRQKIYFELGDTSTVLCGATVRTD